MGQVKMRDQEQLFQMAEHCEILGVGGGGKNSARARPSLATCSIQTSRDPCWRLAACKKQTAPCMGVCAMSGTADRQMVMEGWLERDGRGSLKWGTEESGMSMSTSKQKARSGAVLGCGDQWRGKTDLLRGLGTQKAESGQLSETSRKDLGLRFWGPIQ